MDERLGKKGVGHFLIIKSETKSIRNNSEAICKISTEKEGSRKEHTDLNFFQFFLVRILQQMALEFFSWKGFEATYFFEVYSNLPVCSG